MNEKILLKYAVDYLSRYDSSKKNLIDVLKRKVFRFKITGTEKSKLINILENIIQKLEKNNLINDENFASTKISYLSRVGKSEKYIFNYLIKKGILKSEISKLLKQFKNNNIDWELNSAKVYAKKKKLVESEIPYEKKLAKMARAGFNYEICKKVLG